MSTTKYIYRALIGEGGHARCFLSERDLAGVTQAVVLKIARPGHGRRLSAEVEALAALSNPHIPRVLDRTAVEAVFPHIIGSDLSAVMDDMGELPPAHVAAIGFDIADALTHAHLHCVMHGDISPSNIMIDSDGWCWLIDWGCSRNPPDHTTASRVAGKLPYLSPESRVGKGRYLSDVYALGAVLRDLLAGGCCSGSCELWTLIKSMTATRPGLRPSARTARGVLARLCAGVDWENLGQWALECRHSPVDDGPRGTSSMRTTANERAAAANGPICVGVKCRHAPRELT